MFKKFFLTFYTSICLYNASYGMDLEIFVSTHENNLELDEFLEGIEDKKHDFVMDFPPEIIREILATPGVFLKYYYYRSLNSVTITNWHLIPCRNLHRRMNYSIKTSIDTEDLLPLISSSNKNITLHMSFLNDKEWFETLIPGITIQPN